MKTTKTTTTAYEVENGNGNSDLIIGASNGIFFVKTSDGVAQYTSGDMMEVYGLSKVSLQNVTEQLNR